MVDNPPMVILFNNPGSILCAILYILWNTVTILGYVVTFPCGDYYLCISLDFLLLDLSVTYKLNFHPVEIF